MAKKLTSTETLIAFTKEFETKNWVESVGISGGKLTVFIKDKTKLPSGLTTSFKGYPVEIVVSGKIKQS
jgi:hypothetical protein